MPGAGASECEAPAGGVVVDDVSVTFTNRGQPLLVLDHISLTFPEAGFTCLLGPSGCGKSTLLNLIAGFLRVESGAITMDGRPVREPGPDRGIVFQEYALFPWLTARQNIAFGPENRGVKGKDLDGLVAHYLDLVGLSGFGDQYPNGLSGGMRQRVAIARALANEPRVLLMDEPFGALDALTRQVLMEQLLEIWLRTRTTVVFVTHSIRESVYLATRIAVMSRRPGRIKEMIDVDLPYPRDPTVPEFVRLEDHIYKVLRTELTA